jgi:DNA-binding NarL/FixJ family response regulator
MIRVLIADDHPIVRRGVRQILAEEKDIGVPGEAKDSREALEAACNQEWDLVILDLTMPGRGGLDILKEIKERKPKLPVLILSVHSDAAYAVRALKCGALGYLTKESAPEELVKAIRSILGGRRYLGQAITEKVAERLSLALGALPHEKLSNREFAVMRLLSSGTSVRETAMKLSLSPKTVSTYRARIIQKLGLKTTADLVRYVIEHDLMEE